MPKKNVRDVEIDLFKLGEKSFLGFKFTCDFVDSLGEIIEIYKTVLKISLDEIKCYEYDSGLNAISLSFLNNYDDSFRTIDNSFALLGGDYNTVYFPFVTKENSKNQKAVLKLSMILFGKTFGN